MGNAGRKKCCRRRKGRVSWHWCRVLRWTSSQWTGGRTHEQVIHKTWGGEGRRRTEGAIYATPQNIMLTTSLAYTSIQLYYLIGFCCCNKGRGRDLFNDASVVGSLQIWPGQATHCAAAQWVEVKKEEEERKKKWAIVRAAHLDCELLLSSLLVFALAFTHRSIGSSSSRLGVLLSLL